MVTFTRRLSNTFDVNRHGIREVVDQTTPNKSSVINAQREAAHINAQEYVQQGKNAIAERGSRAPTKTEIALMERDNALKEAYENRNKPVTFVGGEYHGLGYTAPPAVAGRGSRRESSVTEDGHGLGYMAPPSRSGESVVDQSYSYSIYDSLGREQAITEKQYNEITKAHGGNTDKNIVYTVLPEEVANSGADWWINDRGLYEWTPVTASDKEHLAKLNSQTGKNMTTLTTGAAKSQEYSDKWYSTGGNRRQVKHNEKLSKMKSGDINTNASAKTNTAKEATAITIPGETSGAKKGAQALAEEASIRNGLTKYETKEDFLQVRAEKKAAQEAAKAAEAAYKPIVGIDGQVIAGIEVKGSSKASDKGVHGIVSGEGYTSRGKAVNEFETRKAEAKEAAKARKDLLEGKVGWIHAAKSDDLAGMGKTTPFLTVQQQAEADYSAEHTGVLGRAALAVYSDTKDFESLKKLDHTNDLLNDVTQKYMPTIDTIAEKRTAAFKSVGLEDERQAIQETVYGSKVGKATMENMEDLYNYTRDKPASLGKDIGVAYVGGAVFGGVMKAGTIATRVGLKGAANVTGNLAGKTGSKLLGGAATGLRIGAAASEPIINVGMVGTLGAQGIEVYNTEGVKGVEKLGAELAVGGLGFGKGTKAADKGYDLLKTINRHEVASPVNVDVLAGNAQLPFTRPGETATGVVKDFQTPEGTFKGWHATSDRGLLNAGSVRPGINKYGEIAKARPADNPGLYVSGEQVGLSPHFLRVKGGESSGVFGVVEGAVSSIRPVREIAKGTAGVVKGTAIRVSEIVRRTPEESLKGKRITEEGIGKIEGGFNEMSSPLNPNAVHFEIAGEVKRLPERVRSDTNKADDFLAGRSEIGTPDKGAAYLTTKLEHNVKRGRAEHEATIVPGTKFEIVSENTFFMHEGRRIPITEAKTIRETGTKTAKGEHTKIKELSEDRLYKNEGRGKGYDPVRGASLGKTLAEYRYNAPSRVTALPNEPYGRERRDNRELAEYIETKRGVPDKRGAPYREEPRVGRGRNDPIRGGKTYREPPRRTDPPGRTEPSRRTDSPGRNEPPRRQNPIIRNTPSRPQPGRNAPTGRYDFGVYEPLPVERYPENPRKLKTEQTESIKYKARVKKHYVKDPVAFMLGNKKGRR